MPVAPEPLRETAPERPPGPELSEKGEADEKEPEPEPEPEGMLPVKPQLEQPLGQPGEEGAEDEKEPEKEPAGEQEPEGVLQVTPQLASGGNTPTKSQPAAVKIKRVKSPGGTPGREEVLRQNAILMLCQRWMPRFRGGLWQWLSPGKDSSEQRAGASAPCISPRDHY